MGMPSLVEIIIILSIISIPIAIVMLLIKLLKRKK